MTTALHEAEATYGRPTLRAKAVAAGLGWAIFAPLATLALVRAALAGSAGPAGPWVGALVAAVFLAGTIAAALVAKAGDGRPARVRIANETLTISTGTARRERHARHAREDVTSAFVAPGDSGGERLELELRGGERVVLDYPEGEATRALEALGLDPKKQRTRIPLYGAADRVLFPISGAFLGMLAWLPFAGIAHDASPPGAFASPLGTVIALVSTLPFLLAGTALLQRALHHVVVGAEGIELSYSENFRAKTRHLPFATIRGVASATGLHGRGFMTTVTAKLDDGSEVVVARFAAVHDASHPTAPPRAAPQAEALVKRIAEARQAYAHRESPAASALLESTRGGSWLASLRELAADTGTYRTGSLTRERLLATLEDPRASATHRLGAAVILSARGDEEGIARVRVAADTTASPRVRVALEAVARGELEERALAEALEDEAPEGLVEKA